MELEVSFVGIELVLLLSSHISIEVAYRRRYFTMPSNHGRSFFAQ